MMVSGHERRFVVFKSIKIKNFKCHENLEFEFVPHRMILFTGNNGSGKTSVFSALFWALYDETLEGVSGDDIVRKKSKKDTCVVVEWEQDGDHYRVEAYRKHTKHKNNRYLYRNNENISKPTNRETLDLIEDLIMPKNIFHNCLMFSNFNKEKFTDLTPSGKMDILEKILEIEEFNDYKEKFKNKLKEIDVSFSKISEKIFYVDERIKKSRESIEYKEKRIENIINEKNIRINDILNEMNEIKSNILLCEEYIKNNGNIIEEYTELKKKQGSILSEISLLNEKIKVLNESLKTKYKNILYEYEKNNLTDYNVKIDNLNSELSKITVNIEYIQKEYESKIKEICNKKTNELSILENKKIEDINVINIEKSSLESELKNNIESLEKLREEYRSIKSEIEDINDNLSMEVPICSVCKQNIEGESKDNVIKHKNILEEKISKIKDSGERIKLVVDDIKRKISSLEDRRTKIIGHYENQRKEIEKKYVLEETDNFSVFNKKKEQLFIDKKNVETQINKLKLEMENLLENKKKELIEEYKKEFYDSKINIEKDMEAKNNDLKVIEGNIEKLSSRLEDIKKREKDLMNYKSKYSGLENELKVLEESAAKSVENEKNDILNLKKETEMYIKEKEDIMKNNKEESDKIDIYKFWFDAFGDGGIKGMLIDEIIPFLNCRIKEYFNNVSIKVGFSSVSSTKGGDLRNKFNIDVIQTSNLSSFKELSSGERRMVDIMVMFCLRDLYETRKNVSINLMLLDEVLDSLDEENSTLVTDFLRKLSVDKTIILISHTLRGRNLEVDGFCDIYKF